MDIESYISSGIIEKCVCGLASSDEVKELGSLRKLYPEIESAVVQTESDFEKHLKLYSITPPPGVKDRLLKIISDKQISECHFIKIQASTSIQFFNPTRRWTLIILMILVISVVLNLFFFNKLLDIDKHQSEPVKQENIKEIP
ncbi:hypothetical protein DVR12_15655 [Chitinophaga silvatica]|uniref:Uncharacterized protein n=1 Tax=Chitinophaga silvatica TaxID=2282649 RepID=A0A3E1Y853_9BACT|nr:hypothetical protein [Chitinophaga silvatica]RFS21336.1 hypothetical protein DVR12_15655 [Chitinophaga silvatica]